MEQSSLDKQMSISAMTIKRRCSEFGLLILAKRKLHTVSCYTCSVSWLNSFSIVKALNLI